MLALTSPTSAGASVGRYSSLADSSQGVCYFVYVLPFSIQLAWALSTVSFRRTLLLVSTRKEACGAFIRDIVHSRLKLQRLGSAYSYYDRISSLMSAPERQPPQFHWTSIPYGSTKWKLTLPLSLPYLQHSAGYCSGNAVSLSRVLQKRASQIWKLIQMYSEDMYSVLTCHNVAKHTEFYLGQWLPLVMQGVSEIYVQLLKLM
jgi:hypothetical protein